MWNGMSMVTVCLLSCLTGWLLHHYVSADHHHPNTLTVQGASLSSSHESSSQKVVNKEPCGHVNQDEEMKKEEKNNVQWISDEQHERLDLLSEEEEEMHARTFSSQEEDYKLVLLIRMDLPMTKGKIAAQCCHATLAAYRSCSKKLLQPWLNQGQPKITLKVENEQEMMRIFQKAQGLALNASVIHDAGRTQIPSGSATVLAIGPDVRSKIDALTGHLKLY